MFEKLSDKAKALDDIIDDFAAAFMRSYQIDELCDPSLISEVSRECDRDAVRRR